MQSYVWFVLIICSQAKNISLPQFSCKRTKRKISIKYIIFNATLECEHSTNVYIMLIAPHGMLSLSLCSHTSIHLLHPFNPSHTFTIRLYGRMVSAKVSEFLKNLALSPGVRKCTRYIENSWCKWYHHTFHTFLHSIGSICLPYMRTSVNETFILVWV